MVLICDVKFKIESGLGIGDFFFEFVSIDFFEVVDL